jgi:hypothetical protein
MTLGENVQQWEPAPINGGWPSPIAAPPPPPTGRRRRGPLILTLILALVLAGGGIAAAVAIHRDRNRPVALTVNGVPIDHPAQVLLAAQNVLLQSLHGRTALRDADTRCYFVRTPSTVHAHNIASDVETELTCGPVLFTDSDANEPMIFIDATSQVRGSKVELTPANRPTDAFTHTLPTSAQMVRPDGRSLPADLLSLTPPPAPAADPNTFVSEDAVTEIPNTAVTSLPVRMAGYEGGVVLTNLAQVSRFGIGEGTRSAPAGHRLIEFQVGPIDSSYEDPAPGPLAWGVSIDGGALRDPPTPLAGTANRYVLSVPDSATSVNLVIRSRGVNQSISLLTGKAAAGNIAVLARQNTFASLAKDADLSLLYAGYGQSAQDTVHVYAKNAYLYYWGFGQTVTKFPSSPGKAYLEVPIDYTDPMATDTTKRYAFPTELLTLTPTNGAPIHATDLAVGITSLNDKIFNVFEVPSTFTSGVVTVGGTVHIDANTTVTIANPFSVSVSIPAG